MQVIGAGFGRTGTTSLKAALERLGFGPCYHMQEVISSPRNSALWNHYLDAGIFDWDDVLQGYESAVDWPVSSYYEELAAKYPEAKVILTVRDPERWHESVMRTIYGIYRVTSRSWMFVVARPFVPHTRNILRLTEEIIWDGEFDGRLEEREYAIQIFRNHIQEVKRTIPPERLLVYEVREGWGPLCEFLGVEEPDEEFPRLNDTKAFRRMIVTFRLASLAVPAVLIALAGLTLVRLFGRRHRRSC